jgi:hypothetical protein
MDRVINDDVFVALATRPDLQFLEIRKVITIELISLAKNRQNQNHGRGLLFPQLQKLVCTGEIDGLFSLLPHLTQLTHLDITIQDSHVCFVDIHCPLLDIATFCLNLQFLQLDSFTARKMYISPDELVEFSQALPHLEHLEIEHVRAPGLIKFGHLFKIAESIKDLRLPWI